MTVPHKAVCPRCKAVVACLGVRATLGSHYAHGTLCPGAHLDLCPQAEEPEPTQPDFREQFGTLENYAATCRPLWVAIQEDDKENQE